MATKWKKSTTYDATAEVLLKVMIDEGYQIAQQKNDTAVVDASIKELSRSDKRLKFEIHSTEYARGMTGIDKSKTETSVTEYDWDLERMRGTWVYRSNGALSGRVGISGADNIEAEGEKARLLSEFTFEVRIPLVGGKVEKLVLKEIERGRPKYEATVREFCEKLA